MCKCGVESTAFDREAHEGLDMLQLNESIPYVDIDYIREGDQGGERRRFGCDGSRQKFVAFGGRRAENVCQRSVVK